MKVTMNLPEELMNVVKALTAMGFRVFIVGGFVRDLFTGKPAKDADLEVHGVGAHVDFEQVCVELFGRENVNAVGKSFGVMKVTMPSGEVLDLALPRTETATGSGHKDFAVTTQVSSLEQACARRDFTFNAMMVEVETGELFDFFGGLDDLKNKVVRHTSEQFAADALRVLRAAQLAARFDMHVAPETVALCKTMKHALSLVSVDRFRDEFLKAFEKGVKPARFLEVLEQVGALELFPEVFNLRGVLQGKKHHPEGDALTHTMHTMNAMALVCDREGVSAHLRGKLVLAMMCHDLGKAVSTIVHEDGHINSHGHEFTGVPLAESFCKRVGMSNEHTRFAMSMTALHMRHMDGDAKRTVRRLALKCQEVGVTLQELAFVVEADHSGRPPKPAHLPQMMQNILDVAKDLDLVANPVKPIVLGRHLVARGMKPSPQMGKVLATLFEAQLDGAFDTAEGGLAWLDENPVMA